MKQNTKNLVGIGTLAAAGFILAKQIARNARAYDLTDSVVLITGASRGLGLVLAHEFARHAGSWCNPRIVLMILLIRDSIYGCIYSGRLCVA
jgi:hypothetical protein